MYSRFTRRSKQNISMGSYLHQDELTSLEDSGLMMQNQHYPSSLTQNSKEASILNSILPTIVQSRLPRIPSIRSSVSAYGFVSGRKSEGTVSGATTPGSIFSSSSMTLIGERTSMSSDGESTESYFPEESSLSDEEFPQTPKKNRQLQTMGSSETTSGIGWKFANQGYNLLTLSFEESSAPSQNTRFGNTSLARQLYVHALTYLLRALPSDLTTEENMSLQTAIPKEVVESLQEESNTNESSQNSSLNNPPSLLQRSVAATIIQLFILFQFILPYVKYLLISAYQYDRTHKISEKVLSRGIVTVDTIGKSGLAVTGAIYGMGDGKVGRVLTDAAAWVVEGVTGGVHEGVSEGLVILGAKNGSVGKKK